ncbi:MAG TPA: oxalate/formate MFS antiporter [Blastocatellia bacterium]|nr:oxalate/formate MFS antiporter [Blastocatellia bacterium]
MTQAFARSRNADFSRWFKLAACIVAMMAVANIQYAWTLFTNPLVTSLGRSLAAIQFAFTCFVIVQTCFLPANAYLIDRVGPRIVVSIGALFVAASWVGSGFARSLAVLYISYALGGVGVGAVYGASMGIAMKWFPDRRGLCVGVVAGSYGFGTALTVLPVSSMIDSRGYQAAFLLWGGIQGIIVLIAAQFMSLPRDGWAPKNWNEVKTRIQGKVLQSGRDYTAVQMLGTRSFYLLYLMMAIVAFSGLMVTAQLGPIAGTYGFDKRVLFGTVTVLNLTMLLDGVLNGVTRPLFGWISDQIGRYETMAISFVMEALAITGLTFVGNRPGWFIILMGLTFFAWGEIYSLFPSAIADLYGSRYATTNFGIQYTSKGVASIMAGPGAAFLSAINHSWTPALWTATFGNILAAALAVFWLRPMVKRHIAGLRSASEDSANSRAEAFDPGQEDDQLQTSLGT